MLDKINNQSEKNLNTLEKKHKKLDDIILREKKIGFWRLLIMAIFALLLFILTGALIFVDRSLFGRWF